MKNKIHLKKLISLSLFSLLTSVKNRNAFDWFRVNFVPYVGVNGNYFLNGSAESMLKLEGLVE